MNIDNTTIDHLSLGSDEWWYNLHNILLCVSYSFWCFFLAATIIVFVEKNPRLYLLPTISRCICTSPRHPYPSLSPDLPPPLLSFNLIPTASLFYRWRCFLVYANEVQPFCYVVPWHQWLFVHWKWVVSQLNFLWIIGCLSTGNGCRLYGLHSCRPY